MDCGVVIGAAAGTRSPDPLVGSSPTEDRVANQSVAWKWGTQVVMAGEDAGKGRMMVHGVSVTCSLHVLWHMPPHGTLTGVQLLGIGLDWEREEVMTMLVRRPGYAWDALKDWGGRREGRHWRRKGHLAASSAQIC